MPGSNRQSEWAGCQGLPTLTIGERMLEEAPGVTRLIDRLEAGAVVEEGPPQQVLGSPREARTREFINSIFE